VFKEVSYGIVPMPLWIPQAVMTSGALVLLLALIDELILVLRGFAPSYRSHEDVVVVSKEG
jgi:hypothetical protein